MLAVGFQAQAAWVTEYQITGDDPGGLPPTVELEEGVELEVTAVGESEVPVPTLYGEAESDDILIGGTDTMTEEGTEGFFDVLTSPATEGFFDVTYEMEGVDIPTYEAPPSWLGSLWQGVKEGVTLAFTFDPVKKAERRLEFAETRMRMAAALEGEAQDDPRLRDRAEKMLHKAQGYLEQIGRDQDKWLTKALEAGERGERLLQNIGRHQVSREMIMDRFEETLPDDDRLDRIRQMRQEGLETGKRLLNALDNENIPERVREHLGKVKQGIEAHATDVQRYREEKRQLLERRQQGDEAAQGELRQLQLRRQQQVEQRLNRYGVTAEDDWEAPSVLTPPPDAGAPGVAPPLPPPDDAASGLPTGKRQLMPVGTDVAEPMDRENTIECIGADCPAGSGVSPDVIDPVRPRSVSPDVIDPSAMPPPVDR